MCAAVTARRVFDHVVYFVTVDGACGSARDPWRGGSCAGVGQRPCVSLKLVPLCAVTQALIVWFAVTAFTLFLSFTIYAGQIHKHADLSDFESGVWGPGFGLTIFGKASHHVQCCPPPRPRRCR